MIETQQNLPPPSKKKKKKIEYSMAALQVDLRGRRGGGGAWGEGGAPPTQAHYSVRC